MFIDRSDLETEDHSTWLEFTLCLALILTAFACPTLIARAYERTVKHKEAY